MSNQPATSLEPSEELARLRDDLIAFYRPAGSQERMVVERIALAQQSMLRAARLEASLFASAPEGELYTILETEAFKIFLRYQAQAERSYRLAVKELKALREDRLFLSAAQLAAPVLQPQRAAAPSSPPRAQAAGSSASAIPSPAASRALPENLALRL